MQDFLCPPVCYHSTTKAREALEDREKLQFITMEIPDETEQPDSTVERAEAGMVGDVGIEAVAELAGPRAGEG